MYRRSVLPNGVRIVTEYIPHVRSASIGVWIDTGSRDEGLDEQGFSHFIEHLVFKGSERFSARDIAELMDTCGGHLNAFTSKEHTCYFARVLDENFMLAVDLLREMLMHSLFAPEDMEKERGVILEEIKMLEDTPDELVHELIGEALWPDNALGRSILGTRESILGASRDKLVSFMHRMYSTDRLVIAVAGNLEHGAVVDAFAELFDGWPDTSFRGEGSASVADGRRVVRFKDTEQVHLCLGGRGLPRSDRRKYALYLLDTIIGGGMSSRLFQELREERGLVYSTYSYHSSYRDTGSFTVYAACSPEHLVEVMDIIKRELTALAADSVDASELLRAKGQLKGSLMLSLENTTNRMTRLAKNELNFGKLFTTDETIDAIDAVSPQDIQELAQAIYAPDSWSTATIGPQGDLAPLKLAEGWVRL